ncbi:hypothetical protein GCM10017774_32400 [Lentzea cavernae]|uniref:Uncharacterized protein n=1 Tax=Lentzea cavernae TaxID=2020703 RepID=A0ABQ3MFQ1_9PSEU|nr:hypothetical protein GCM10017774_32400 [Lentzea cavernae]
MNDPFHTNASNVGLESRKHTSNVGGSTDTLDNDDTVIPQGSAPSPNVVTTATPVGNAAINPRNCSLTTKPPPAQPRPSA